MCFAILNECAAPRLIALARHFHDRNSTSNRSPRCESKTELYLRVAHVTWRGPEHVSFGASNGTAQPRERIGEKRSSGKLQNLNFQGKQRKLGPKSAETWAPTQVAAVEINQDEINQEFGAYLSHHGNSTPPSCPGSRNTTPNEARNTTCPALGSSPCFWNAGCPFGVGH